MVFSEHITTEDKFQWKKRKAILVKWLKKRFYFYLCKPDDILQRVISMFWL